jgi:CCR4-NOT transcriptional regulation complex NOT5 subunit
MGSTEVGTRGAAPDDALTTTEPEVHATMSTSSSSSSSSSSSNSSSNSSASASATSSAIKRIPMYADVQYTSSGNIELGVDLRARLLVRLDQNDTTRYSNAYRTTSSHASGSSQAYGSDTGISDTAPSLIPVDSYYIGFIPQPRILVATLAEIKARLESEC